MWAAYGVHALHGWGQPYPVGGVVLAVMALVAALLRVRREARPAAPPSLSVAEQQRDAKEGRVFAWVNARQGVAIFLMVQVCINLHHPEYIAPLFALIVGLYFFVLAPAMRASSLWATGDHCRKRAAEVR